MYHRKISLERELLKEALKCYEIMEVLEDTRVKKTMSDIGPYYPKLVKEFIVNFPKGFNDVGVRSLGRFTLVDTTLDSLRSSSVNTEDEKEL